MKVKDESGQGAGEILLFGGLITIVIVVSLGKYMELFYGRIGLGLSFILLIGGIAAIMIAMEEFSEREDNSMNDKTIAIVAAVIIVIGAVGNYAYYAYTTVTGPDESMLRISTTLDLKNTGLLRELEAAYEKKYPGVDVRVIIRGDIEDGETGDVDLMLFHDKAKETKFVNEGFGTNRTEFAFNHFRIVGPADDPASIKGLNATEAFKRIAEEGIVNPQVKFVAISSPFHDDTGTYERKKRIWNASGINRSRYEQIGGYVGLLWYQESGDVMEDTIVRANEKNAYTIIDSMTFLTFFGDGRIKLVPLVTTGKDLLNVYTAIPINPQRHPRTNVEAGNNFINFMLSPEGQKIIGNFGKAQFGEPLFTTIPTHPVPA